MVKPLQVLNNMLYPHSGESRVTYILSGSPADFNITYTGSDAGMVQEPHVTKSWKKSFTVRDGEFVYFSAQSNTQHSKIHVKILVDGKVFRKSDAKGDYAIATAAGCVTCNKKQR
jgi:hypothetical protein